MKTLLRSASALLASVLLSLTAARAETVIRLQAGVAPTADYVATGTYLRGPAPRPAETTLFIGRSSGGEAMRALLQFDLKPLGSRKIKAVRFWLRPTGAAQPGDSTATLNLDVYALTAPFDAATATPAKRSSDEPWTGTELALNIPKVATLAWNASLAASPDALEFPASPAFLAAVEKARQAGQPLALLLTSSLGEKERDRWVAAFYSPTAGTTEAEKKRRRPMLEITVE
jgi:hypothetical protein